MRLRSTVTKTKINMNEPVVCQIQQFQHGPEVEGALQYLRDVVPVEPQVRHVTVQTLGKNKYQCHNLQKNRSTIKESSLNNKTPTLSGP